MSSTEDLKTSTSSPVPDPDRHRSNFQDRALMLFYAVAIGVAMCGWLWFLGWLLWEIVSWIVSRNGLNAISQIIDDARYSQRS
jgi:hypothetical protein